MSSVGEDPDDDQDEASKDDKSVKIITKSRRNRKPKTGAVATL